MRIKSMDFDQMAEDLVNSQNHVRQLQEQLAEAVAGKMPEVSDLDPKGLFVQPLVSIQTGEPLIQIRWFLNIAQMNLDGARMIAVELLQAAHEAEYDSQLWAFIRESTTNDDAAAGLFYAFRAFRDERLYGHKQPEPQEEKADGCPAS